MPTMMAKLYKDRDNIFHKLNNISQQFMSFLFH